MPSITELEEIQRLTLVKHYFSSGEEGQRGKFTDTISKFKEDFPSLAWYPTSKDLKSFIDQKKHSLCTIIRVKTLHYEFQSV